jgi:glutamate-1-semialdehyde 2,1-aminomutase
MRGYREPFSASVSHGVPGAVADSVRTASVADPADTVARELETGDVAVVILEPSGATWGTVPLGFGVLRELRALCDRHDALLMFDEVITGFRYSPGGVQAVAQVTPDLSSLGKTLTGGLPGGALVGRGDIMDAFRPGRDTDEPYVFHFGTFNGHPLTASAGVATLRVVRTGEPHSVANAYAERLRAGIQELLDELDIRGIAYGDASMFHVYLESPDAQRHGPLELATTSPYDLLAMPPALCDALQFQLRLRGVDLVAFNGGFVSSEHGESELDQSLEAFLGALRAMRDDATVATS